MTDGLNGFRKWVFVGLLVVVIIGLFVYRQYANKGDSLLQTGTAMESLEGFDRVLAKTHESVKNVRESVLTMFVQKPYPDGDNSPWGDVHFVLAALYLDHSVSPYRNMNAQIAAANERIQALAKEHPIAITPRSDRSDQPPFYFSLPVYAKIYYYFSSNGTVFPGRLTPESEKVMKEQMWRWVQQRSYVAEASLARIWEVYDSENHDLIHKVPYYLFSYVLKDDPDYANRKYADGHTAEEHYNAWNEYFKVWLKERALKGMFVELGSSTYQKYSLSAILALADVAPDDVVRQRAKMLLDLAFIDEAQMSFESIRGGGKSRAKSSYVEGTTGIRHILGVLYGRRMIGKTQCAETFAASTYMLPEEAIWLTKFEKYEQPYEVINRVPGEGQQVPGEFHGPVRYRLETDYTLLNYVYKTPTYMIGGKMRDPNLRYTEIDTELVWSGVVFNDEAKSVVIPFPEGTFRGTGNFRNAYWSVHYRNAMITQKWRGTTTVNRMRVYFSPQLERVETAGWVFARTSNAFVAVRPAYGGYEWDMSGAWTVTTASGDTVSQLMVLKDEWSPIVFYAGDSSEFGSFENFVDELLRSELTIESDGVFDTDPDEITFVGPNNVEIKFFARQELPSGRYKLPTVNGKVINLKPEYAYDSPYVKSIWGSHVVTVTVGDYVARYDFVDNTVERKKISGG